MKKVVIDTNVLLVSISERSKLHWVFKSLIEKKFTLCVTTEILAEYAEVLERHMGIKLANKTLKTIQYKINIEKVTTYYKFRLLKDEDDDKFVDCAIAANASYIVSHDSDFKILSQIPFPKVRVIDTEEFKKDLEE